MQPEFIASYTATAATVTLAASGRGVIHTVTIPKALVGTLSYQDTASNVYFALPTGTVGGSLRLDSTFNAGLKVVQSSASDQVTTTWQQG